MVDFNLIHKYMMQNEYLTPRKIMYGEKEGFCIGPYGYEEFLKFKSKLINNSSKLIINLGEFLKSFDGKGIYLSFCCQLTSLLDSEMSMVLEDFSSNNGTAMDRNVYDVIKSRIYSEIEGTLSIESVQTTRKRVAGLDSGKIQPESKNDQIVKNMIEGVKFVLSNPDFNKENLGKLYELLSRDSLEDDYKLHKDCLYRYDEVEIDGYAGCPHEKIDECMDTLFSFVEKAKKGEMDRLVRFMMPHIAHYYILYIHPYFDFNGRTARMVSFWISKLLNVDYFSIVSEAIDQTKNRYYEALRNSRNSNNDITYFLIYLSEISIDYYNCYKNLEEIDQRLKNKCIVLTEAERSYFKKILVSNRGKFTYRDFANWIKLSVSKQGIFKILNTLEGYGLLKSAQSGNNKLFYVNDEMITYRMSNYQSE